MRKITNILMLILAVALLTAVSGCTTSAQQSAAELRWERTLEQARLDAARQSLAEGQFEYAKRVLQPCTNSADVQKLMLEIQAAQQVYAQLTASRYNLMN